MCVRSVFLLAWTVSGTYVICCNICPGDCRFFSEGSREEGLQAVGVGV